MRFEDKPKALESKILYQSGSRWEYNKSGNFRVEPGEIVSILTYLHLYIFNVNIFYYTNLAVLISV